MREKVEKLLAEEKLLREELIQFLNTNFADEILKQELYDRSIFISKLEDLLN